MAASYLQQQGEGGTLFTTRSSAAIMAPSSPELAAESPDYATLLSQGAVVSPRPRPNLSGFRDYAAPFMHQAQKQQQQQQQQLPAFPQHPQHSLAEVWSDIRALPPPQQQQQLQQMQQQQLQLLHLQQQQQLQQVQQQQLLQQAQQQSVPVPFPAPAVNTGPAASGGEPLLPRFHRPGIIEQQPWPSTASPAPPPPAPSFRPPMLINPPNPF
jgi:hypothetical protein